MKTLAEKISVMQAALDGKGIEWSYKNEDIWYKAREPDWDWDEDDYRIKQEPMESSKKINDLERRLERVYQAGIDGIGYVGQANYASREQEANEILETAMFGEVTDEE